MIGIGYYLDLQRYSDYHDSLIASSSRFLRPHENSSISLAEMLLVFRRGHPLVTLSVSLLTDTDWVRQM